MFFGENILYCKKNVVFDRVRLMSVKFLICLMLDWNYI